MTQRKFITFNDFKLLTLTLKVLKIYKVQFIKGQSHTLLILCFPLPLDLVSCPSSV